LVEWIGRDEYRLDESKIWPNFEVDMLQTVNIVGFFFVPGKILIAVGKPIEGIIDIPCVALAKNSWPHQAKDTMDLCEQAV